MCQRLTHMSLFIWAICLSIFHPTHACECLQALGTPGTPSQTPGLTATNRTDQIPALKEVTPNEGDTRKNKTNYAHVQSQEMLTAITTRCWVL